MQKPWIMQPRTIAAVLGLLVAYAVIANAIGIPPLGIAAIDEDILEYRLSEFLLLWLAAISAIGWWGFRRGRRPEYAAAIRPILIPPAIAAVVQSAMRFAEALNQSRPSTIGAIPVPGSSTLTLASYALSAFPLIAGAVVAYCLILQARTWRLQAAPGICPVCNYDLTGNYSGVCPECGEKTGADPEVPAYFQRPHWGWPPEFREFPDAKSRQMAQQQAVSELSHSLGGWVGMALIVVALLVQLPFFTRGLGRWGWATSTGLTLTAAAILFWTSRRTMRRSLQRQLADRKAKAINHPAHPNAPKPSAEDNVPESP